MVTPVGWIGRALYAVLFVAVVPAALVVWARATEALMPIEAVDAPVGGVGVAVGGALLLAAGWQALIVHGRGLPMNAFPPPRFVQHGIYHWIRNPIYIGFGLIVAGISIATGSASGLWLVTPVVVLGAAALVFGFERSDLECRFGRDALTIPWLSIPRGDDDRPSAAGRAAVFAWILIPWSLTWFAAQAVGPSPDAFGTQLGFERHWPIWEWAELPYVSAYLFIPLTVFVAASARSLRRFAVSGGVAMVIVTIVWFTIPVVATNRDFVPATALGRLLAWEQGHSTGVAAFPAFHALWALIAASVWSEDGRRLGRPARGWLGWTWAWAIVASCLATGMHTVIDLAVAVGLYPLVRDPVKTWDAIRARTEAHANSWREWRFGPVRVINHGVFAAAAAGVGFAVIAMALPPDAFGLVVWISVCSVLGAGIWAQILEGSSVLLRPFGWYGGVLGAVFAVVTAGLAGAAVIPLVAAVTLAGPWIQALGRLRCLVQGCCHGGPAAGWVGIRYRHRRSRVTQIAKLGGEPIHATPLYSIAANIVIGVILLRLRWLGAADVLVAGLYLILNGLARFVEEGYRAEPQTPIIFGLHSYQWLAMASVLAGAWVTTLPAVTAGVGFGPLTVRIATGAVIASLVTGLAMGVDFPSSNRRFSRLAPAD